MNILTCLFPIFVTFYYEIHVILKLILQWSSHVQKDNRKTAALWLMWKPEHCWCASSNTGQFYTRNKSWNSFNSPGSNSFDTQLTHWFLNLKLEAPYILSDYNRGIFGLFWRVVLLFIALHRVEDIEMDMY